MSMVAALERGCAADTFECSGRLCAFSAGNRWLLVQNWCICNTTGDFQTTLFGGNKNRPL